MKTNYFYSQRASPLPRTAIEAEILFAACVMQVRFLKRPSGKTPLKKNSSGKKIEAESAVPILVYLCIVLIVHKYRQSAKESCSLKRNTVSEVFPLSARIAGSGKTKPFEKRRSRYKETAENKAEAYRVYVEHLFSACDAVDARIFSKGDGNMTRKMSTTNLPGARGNAYPKAELDYELTYEYDPAYAHRLVHAGNRYYRYDANGNITAEKDGPFTEEDEFVFTYNYDPDTDVYGTDYGFGLDAPKETEESHPENLFAYRRNYTWNEKNLLTKSSDRSYTVHYRYGEDGQRALKYTEEGRSETLYFNNFYTIHIPVQDKNNPQGLRVHKHIFVGNSRLVTAMTHTDNNGDNAEQREKRYYYHSDHLGSAQFVTDWRGRQYEHIEYTPYGELWIEEVSAGLDKLPFRFTGKEMDEETGLYYYGARYLDPKYSRWLSGDPALSEYIPKAPIDDEAKKHNENLPGMGGVFNVVNLHLYHYAGNNPVKYTDPDGKSPLSLLIPNPEKISKEDARKWIDDNVCTNNFGFLICQDMYTKSFRGDTSDYVKGKDTYIATAMRNDTDAYANKIIKTRLKAGITEGSGGTTSWTKNDLKLSVGSCGFSWKLDSYDEKNKIATVTVTVTDIFDFNKDDKGNRDADAEKLTALGRKAELSSYNVEVTYELQIKVSIPLTEEK
ncbi:RHS repeat domain-containing protein [Treponema vincentii]|uniref:RHS repeat domain-containing protein n=1 Tax=Treponema vincentii TaxID=69710 RepID=UPI0039BEED7E